MTYTSARRRPPFLVILGIAFAILGGTGMVAGVAIGYLIADHSSSDSSVSSQIAIGLGGFGFLAVLAGGALLGVAGLVGLRRRPRG